MSVLLEAGAIDVGAPSMSVHPRRWMTRLGTSREKSMANSPGANIRPCSALLAVLVLVVPELPVLLEAGAVTTAGAVLMPVRSSIAGAVDGHVRTGPFGSTIGGQVPRQCRFTMF